MISTSNNSSLQHDFEEKILDDKLGKRKDYEYITCIYIMCVYITCIYITCIYITFYYMYLFCIYYSTRINFPYRHIT